MAKTIGIIGLGKMGRCLLSGLLESASFKKADVYFTTKHDETAKKVVEDFGKTCTEENYPRIKNIRRMAGEFYEKKKEAEAKK